jgi:hypothetical protein
LEALKMTKAGQSSKHVRRHASTTLTPSRPLGLALVPVAAAATVSAAWLLLANTALAEPVLDRALSGAQVLHKPNCTLLKVNFNFRVSYSSHFPLSRGDELRVTIRAIDPAQAAALALLKREALRAPESKPAAVKTIELEANQPPAPVLRIQFLHSQSYQVAQGPDFESIVIAIAGASASADCKPVFPSTRTGGWDTTVQPGTTVTEPKIAAPRAKERGANKPTAVELRAIAASMDEARAALKKGDTATAAGLLTKALR